MSTLNVATIQSPTANTPTSFKDSSGTSVGTLIKAHAHFDGANPNSSTTTALYNVTDITDLGVGYYRLNFTNQIRDNSGTITAKYAVSGSSNGPVTPTPNAHCHLFVLSPQLSDRLEIMLFTDEDSTRRMDGIIGIIISA